MLLPRTGGLPLPIHAPKLPDRWLCSPKYGTDISATECSILVDTVWPTGNTPIHYYFRDPSPSNSIRIPKTNDLGTCRVAIEPAGPNYRYPDYFKLRPNQMRGLAGFVIQRCAVEGEGIGGFVTLGLAAAEAYVQSVTNDWSDDMRNATEGNINNGAFITISINGANRTSFAPGDNDPAIAGYLSSYAAYASMLFTEKMQAYQTLAAFLHDRAITMIRGGTGPWWDGRSFGAYAAIKQEDGADSANSTTNNNNDNNGGGLESLLPDIKGKPFDEGEMTYQCDTTLGAGGEAPEAVDCEKLGWGGLTQDPSGDLTLKPGEGVRFWSEGTCTLAASTTIPLPATISWAHILSAFNTLSNLCVQNPIRVPQGGRAYFGRQAVSSWIHGKRGAKRDSVGGVDGGTALPRGWNVTIFRTGSWRGTGGGKGGGEENCKWALAQEGKNVSLCDGG